MAEQGAVVMAEQGAVQLFVRIRGTGLPEHGKSIVLAAAPSQTIATTYQQLLKRLHITGSKELQLTTASGARLADQATAASLRSPFLTLCAFGSCMLCGGFHLRGYPCGGFSCRNKRCAYFGTQRNNGFCSQCRHDTECTTVSSTSAELISGGVGDCLRHVVPHLDPRGWRSLLLLNRSWRRDMHASGPHHVRLCGPHQQHVLRQTGWTTVTADDLRLSALQYQLLLRTGLFLPSEAKVHGARPSLFLAGYAHSERLEVLTLLNCAPAADVRPLAACLRLHTLRLVRCSGLASLVGRGRSWIQCPPPCARLLAPEARAAPVNKERRRF